MWPHAFTDRLNLKWPILRAPMCWHSSSALAAAVGNVGGLGAQACEVFQLMAAHA